MVFDKKDAEEDSGEEVAASQALLTAVLSCGKLLSVLLAKKDAGAGPSSTLRVTTAELKSDLTLRETMQETLEKTARAFVPTEEATVIRKPTRRDVRRLKRMLPVGDTSVDLVFNALANVFIAPAADDSRLRLPSCELVSTISVVVREVRRLAQHERDRLVSTGWDLCDLPWPDVECDAAGVADDLVSLAFGAECLQTPTLTDPGGVKHDPLYAAFGWKKRNLDTFKDLSSAVDWNAEALRRAAFEEKMKYSFHLEEQKKARVVTAETESFLEVCDERGFLRALEMRGEYDYHVDVLLKAMTDEATAAALLLQRETVFQNARARLCLC